MGVLPPEKKKKKNVESAEDDEEIRRRRDGGFTHKQEGKKTHRCFFTAENFSETMCFKKLKQKKKI